MRVLVEFHVIGTEGEYIGREIMSTRQMVNTIESDSCAGTLNKIKIEAAFLSNLKSPLKEDTK